MFLFALGILFPRLAIVLMGFFTSISKVAIPSHTLLWSIVGFLFAPYTFLWYCFVEYSMEGTWLTWQIAVAGLMMLLDAGRMARTKAPKVKVIHVRCTKPHPA